VKTMYSLTQMAAELERQQATKVDYLAPTDSLHFVSAGPEHVGVPSGTSEIDLLGTDVTGLALTDHAHGQLASRLQIPRKFYDRLRVEVPSLLDENVNRLLRHHPGKPADMWMVRSLDSHARAFLSDSYRDIDNYDIAQTVFPILGEIPDVQIESCALTETRMFIKAVTPRVAGEVNVGDEVCAGVVIRNSEVGVGSFQVQPLIYRLVCRNGMISERGLFRKIHLGQKQIEVGENRVIFRDSTREARDKAFLMEVADVVRAAVDEVNFREVLADLRAAAGTEPLRDVQQAVQVLAKRESLTDGEASGILQHLAAGGDLTQWGLLNAVTRHSQDVDSYDRATELEELGGKILAYSPRDWRQVAEAVA
jgi:Domain of unknown function (DUF932)